MHRWSNSALIMSSDRDCLEYLPSNFVCSSLGDQDDTSVLPKILQRINLAVLCSIISSSSFFVLSFFITTLIERGRQFSRLAVS